jgi:hypothetical protein
VIKVGTSLRIAIRSKWRFHDSDFATERGPPVVAKRLLAYTETSDDFLVSLVVLATEIVEKTAALAYHLEQSLTGVVVLGVDLEVIRQILDASGQNRDLDLGRPGVRVVDSIVLDQLVLVISRERHLGSSSNPAVRRERVR